MKSAKLTMILTIALSLVSMGAYAATTGASIYMDEDFEGTDVFQELNWPVIDSLGDVAQIDIRETPVQGYEVRAASLASTGPMVALQVTEDASTETTTSRFFTGEACLALTTATLISSPFVDAVDEYVDEDNNFVEAAAPTIPLALSEGTRLFQVAVSFNQSTAVVPLPGTWPANGTTVGKVRLQHTVAGGTGTTVTKNIDVDFVVNSSSAIDIVSLHPNGVTTMSTVIGSMSGGADSWAMLSILTNNSVSTDTTEGGSTKQVGSALWIAYDPITETYKGPQPVNPLVQDEDRFGQLDTFTSVSSGIHIFLNANVPAISYSPSDIGGNWGNLDGADLTHLADPLYNNVAGLGWEISATSIVGMYVDDIYWDANGHDDPRLSEGGFSREQAARMQAFDATSAETAPLAVKSPWYLLEE